MLHQRVYRTGSGAWLASSMAISSSDTASGTGLLLFVKVVTR
jgi:hypothetical protein